MFEEDSEKYATKKVGDFKPIQEDKETEWVSCYEDFQKGAVFGYNKANEWHYPSKGKLPKENKRYLCKIKAFVGGGIIYECFDYDAEYSSWKEACGDVIAWKEIIPPELNIQ